MSATLSGIIIVENPKLVDDSPSSLTLDGQMWLGPGHVLTGVFNYYNSSNLSFVDFTHYLSWIHVRTFPLPLFSLRLPSIDCQIR
jgi:hypothetical protein